MFVEMGYDANLLGDLISDGFAPKQIAYLTGRHVNTVYAYQHGTINIPIDFWTKLFKHTRDARIAALIFGDLPHEYVIQADVPDLTDTTALRIAIDSIGKFHDCMRHLAEILADGRINADDRQAVAQFNETYPEFVRHIAGVRAAVNKAFESATAPRRS